MSLVVLLACSFLAPPEPTLPDAAGTVSLPAQEWPAQPGPRAITVHVRYPGTGKLTDVKAGTGLMLSLHNWGGTGFTGTAAPATLANRYDVVVIGVDYLQSGPQAGVRDKEPYDYGWLQALDALRALHFVADGLKQRGVAFDSSRIYATGGSGGGNVTSMANKLAPRTFAVIIDLCGMKKLSDDIAFNLPGGSSLDARYSRDKASPNYLTPDAQEIRFVGHPKHLEVMKGLGCATKIIAVHGSEDAVCPFADAKEYAANMKASGLDFTFVPVTGDLLDGTIFTSAGHALGDRTRIVEKVAGKYLTPGSADLVKRRGPTDFERKETIRYPTAHGTWVVSYEKGYPVGTFQAVNKP